MSQLLPHASCRLPQVEAELGAALLALSLHSTAAAAGAGGKL